MAQGKRNEPAEVLRARRFELVDDTGQVIAVLQARGESEGEGASLTLRDAEGQDRLAISGFEDSGDIYIMGTEDDDDLRIDVRGVQSPLLT
jgi:hypothetical protein